MEHGIYTWIINRELAEPNKHNKSNRISDEAVASIVENAIRISIQPNWVPSFKENLSIHANNVLVLNLNHPHGYGHIYTEVFSELYSVEKMYSEYDCILTVLTPLMENVINTFQLNLSTKIKFLSTKCEKNKQFIIKSKSIKIVNHMPKTYVNKAENVYTLKSAFHLSKPIINNPKSYLLYCSRNTETTTRNGRRLTQENECQIIKVLTEHATKHNLTFCLWTGQEEDGTITSIAKQYELFTNAKIVVGVHGGAMSNLIFLDPNKRTKVIELCPSLGKNFKSLFDDSILAFADYHQILYQLPFDATLLTITQAVKMLQTVESTININELQRLLNS